MKKLLTKHIFWFGVCLIVGAIASMTYLGFSPHTFKTQDEGKPLALASNVIIQKSAEPSLIASYQTVQIGRSTSDVSITATRYGQGEKFVLVLGGIHGNEPSSVRLAKALDKSLEQNYQSNKLAIIVVSVVNPDGCSVGTRVNARGVDINRNFPSISWRREATKSRYNPGNAAASEPETQAIINLISQYNPVLIISIHAPFACVNWDGPADYAAGLISQLAGYPLKPSLGYETPGSLGAYAGVDRKIPIVTLELRAVETDEQIEKNIKALRTLFLCISDF